MATRNPIFLPTSFFDSYVVRSTTGNITVDRIQTLKGAEKKVTEMARKYPCLGWEIKSKKFGSLVKSYTATAGRGAPKVDEDNTRKYKERAVEAVEEGTQYRLYVGREEYATYDTEKEAKEVGAKEAKKQRTTYKVKVMKGNPKDRLDLLLDSVTPRHEVTIDGEGYSVENVKRIEDRAKGRGLHASSDGRFILIRDLSKLHGSKQNPRKRNGSSSDAADLYERFHGKPSEETLEIITDEFERVNLATLGDLISMKVETTTGKLAELNAPNPEEVSTTEIIRLASCPNGKQLYLVGGDQEIPYEALGFKDRDVRDFMVIGLVTEITYRTRKHFDNFEEIDYYHETGEETKAKTIADEFRKRPTLIYHPNDKTMRLAGGLYEVLPAGITN